jgi:hypothetical protein
MCSELEEIIDRYPFRHIFYVRSSDKHTWHMDTPTLYCEAVGNGYYVMAAKTGIPFETLVRTMHLDHNTVKTVRKPLVRNPKTESVLMRKFPNRRIFYQRSDKKINVAARGLWQKHIGNNYHVFAVEEFYPFDLTQIYPTLDPRTYIEVYKPPEFEDTLNI